MIMMLLKMMMMIINKINTRRDFVQSHQEMGKYEEHVSYSFRICHHMKHRPSAFCDIGNGKYAAEWWYNLTQDSPPPSLGRPQTQHNDLFSF